jgi:hypothetical protein
MLGRECNMKANCKGIPVVGTERACIKGDEIIGSVDDIIKQFYIAVFETLLFSAAFTEQS